MAGQAELKEALGQVQSDISEIATSFQDALKRLGDQQTARDQAFQALQVEADGLRAGHAVDGQAIANLQQALTEAQNAADLSDVTAMVQNLHGRLAGLDQQIDQAGTSAPTPEPASPPTSEPAPAPETPAASSEPGSTPPEGASEAAAEPGSEASSAAPFSRRAPR